MKKLTLDVDTLTVQSFEAVAPDTSLGTVHGREVSLDSFRPCATECTCPNTQ